MQRLIPNKTKVRIELFRGVGIGDLIVCAIALLLLVFLVTSNLSWRWWLSLVVIGITALLVVRTDSQPNYVYFLHVLSFFSFRRRFQKTFTDDTLSKILEDGQQEAMLGELFEPDEAEEETEDRSSKKKERKSKKEKGSSKKGKNAEPVSEEVLQKRAWAKDAQIRRDDMDEIIPFTGIKDSMIEYLGGEYYGAVLQIDPVEFRFMSESRRSNSIDNCLGRVLRSINVNYSANIVKLEQPIIYDGFVNKEYQKLDDLATSYENAVLSEDELKSRVEIEYDRLNELLAYRDNSHIVTSYFYLVLFESDKRQLELQMRDAEQVLSNGEMKVRRLNDKQLAVFLKYSNQIDFDEREVENIRPEELHLWAMPSVVDIKPRRVEVNHIITHNFRVYSYPTIVDDAWLATLMSYPGTKVVVKCKPVDRNRAIRNIDNSLTELRGQWSATGIDSKRMEIETHISTLQDLLATLQSDTESLLEVNVYITAYDIVATRANKYMPQPPASDLPNMSEMKKSIRRTWQEHGFRLSNMEFEQVQAFIGSQISGLDPLGKEGRDIASNTVAACYPWVFAHISDEGGVKLGQSDGVPVFIDFFKRDSERVNSNMVIVGKSGSGKSYATKSLLANLAAEDAKIFILDPENEYTELASNLHGQIINVGNAMYGRLNPFHIITALDDDEAGEGGPSGSYATHLQFLEEFFRQIMPDCEKDAMEYLNTLVDHMYLTHNITADTDLSKLLPEDYPIFDDLYDEVLQEFQSSDNVFTRDLLRSLMNYVSKFSTGGRNANIWNGPSTITTDENFTVFNFQSMLANRNSTIANAQMLLVLKYIDNEIIKNRDYNLSHRANRKVVVVIDEAHVFIDAKFPVALDFMFQLAKRIRKYNGMQIVITQNIKDFVGSEELARKSTAIINACQYSFIFALAPNDMQDLIRLYASAGGINESEQEQIVQAPRGQAFTIMSPTSRSTFRIETAPGISDLFESPYYESHYFTGEEGDKNWEDFIGTSRALHDQTVSARGRLERRDDQMAISSGVSLKVYDQEEYDELKAKENPVSIQVVEIPEDDEVLTIPDRPEPKIGPRPGEEPEVEETVREERGLQAEAPQISSIQAQIPPLSQPSMQDQSMAVFGMIAQALGRMADAAERSGEVPFTEPARQGYVAQQMSPSRTQPEPEMEQYAPEADEKMDHTSELLKEQQEQFAALQAEMRAEIERLKQENQQLKTAPVPVPEETEEEEEALLDDEFGGEEEGDLSLLYEDPDIEDDLDDLDDLDEDFDEDDDFDEEDEAELEDDDDLAELDFGLDDDLLDAIDDDEDSDSDSEFEDEIDEDDEFLDDDEFDFDDEDEEDEDEEGDDEDEEDEEDDDFMASFCSFATNLMNMNAFERMRIDGKEVMTITLDDLIREAEEQQKARRHHG
ncbi:MAG: DUF87 domain-containing protein [Firmicutes bacterium]|nr:DUF87 domain-containing protein [Bacillota bacterium]